MVYELKEKFVKQLIDFMHERKFLIHSKDVYTEMPVLISACAVQITFGLDKKLLDEYKTIKVYRTDFATKNLRVLSSQTGKGIISLAWNKFYAGYEMRDGVNTGLGEMSNALYYQSKNGAFTKLFPHYSKVYETLRIICKMHRIKNSCRFGLYNADAFKSTHDYFTASLILFFEKPEQLTKYYFDIYNGFRKLLQQNPLQKQNPLLIEN